MWKESLTPEFIYPSLPFLAPGKEKGWPTARAHNAPPGTLKRKNYLLGEAWQLFWDLAMEQSLSLWPSEEKAAIRSYLGLTRPLLYPQDAMKVHPCSVKPNLRTKAICKAHHKLSISQRSCKSWVWVLWAEGPRLSSGYVVTFFCPVASGRKRKAWCLWGQSCRRATSTTYRWESSPLSGYMMTSPGDASSWVGLLQLASCNATRSLLKSSLHALLSDSEGIVQK